MFNHKRQDSEDSKPTTFSNKMYRGGLDKSGSVLVKWVNEWDRLSLTSLVEAG